MECTTRTANGPQAPTRRPQAMAVGGSKNVAEGVRTGSNPRRPDRRYPIAWLHIATPRGATPTATSKCRCGWDRSAVGQRRVLALIEAHAAHRDTCPLRTPQEGTEAA
ncbi:hypothetical protein [Streptomyces sp. DB-54]